MLPFYMRATTLPDTKGSISTPNNTGSSSNFAVTPNSYGLSCCLVGSCLKASRKSRVSTYMAFSEAAASIYLFRISSASSCAPRNLRSSRRSGAAIRALTLLRRRSCTSRYFPRSFRRWRLAPALTPLDRLGANVRRDHLSVQ